MSEKEKGVVKWFDEKKVMVLLPVSRGAMSSCITPISSARPVSEV